MQSIYDLPFTGKVLQDVSLDPDTPDEAADIQDLDLDVEDEGFEEEQDDDDPTVHRPAPSSIPSAAWSGDPADAPPSGPSRPAAPEAFPQSPATLLDRPWAPTPPAPTGEDSQVNNNRYKAYQRSRTAL